MKYRTVIEIVTEAKNKNEAIGLVGEYLNGEIEDGVSMRCYSKPLSTHFLLRSTLFFSLVFLIISSLSFGYFKKSPAGASGFESFSACPPPLQTSEASGFKDTWKTEETNKTLEVITR